MKHLISTILFLFSLSGFASEKLGQINDPDGFSNVRENKSSKSKILFRIIDGEYFYFQENDASHGLKLLIWMEEKDSFTKVESAK